MGIRHKLFLLLAGTAALAGLLFGLGMFPLIQSAVRGRYLERVRAETELMAAMAAEHPPDPASAQAWAEDWGRRLGLRLTLIAPDGTVLGDSSLPGRALAGLANHLDRPEIAEARAGGRGEAERRSESTGEGFLYIARRLDRVPGYGYVRIALPVRQVRQAEMPYLLIVGGLLGATPLLLTLLAYAAVRRWSRPLEQLTGGAGRIAAGELDAPLPVAGEDEIGRLGRSLDRMRHSIALKIAEAEGERRFLDSVIAGMKEGLLLVDGQRKVRIANDAFLRTWGVRSDPRGRPLVEVVRHPRVLAAVDAVLSGTVEVRERVLDPATGRAFEMHASRQAPDESRTGPVTGPAGPSVPAPPDPAGAIVLFFDVTRLEALESMRKEFVANVSHELRTPLTSIKASVLTLIDADGAPPEVTQRFLETIRRNAERMAALVEDLTDLSLIETGAIKLDVRRVDLAPVARDVVAQLAPRYAASDVAVEVEVPAGMTVAADRRRLEQVLVNLVDNALKFNRPGGRVRLEAHPAADGRGVITVEDTGDGIPSDHLERIFHRFHRVDPARANELGGTGLGLAIVKHLVQLHGGSVRVESELGKGSQFVVEI